MGKYVLAYTGGGEMGESEEEQKEIMGQWMNWFGALGEAVVDGGAPFGESATVDGSGEVSEPASLALSGYSIITADSLEDAAEKAKGCPVLAGGGSVEVYEAMPMG
jgi:hypothetical protein